MPSYPPHPVMMSTQVQPSAFSSSPPSSSNNSSLKSGPQVLIKNVNGRVTITPVPGTGATPVDTAEMLKKATNGGPAAKKPPGLGNAAVNGKKSQLANVRGLESTTVQKSHSVPNVNGHIDNIVASNGDVNDKKNGKVVKDRRKYSFSAADGDDPGKMLHS